MEAPRRDINAVSSRNSATVIGVVGQARRLEPPPEIRVSSMSSSVKSPTRALILRAEAKELSSARFDVAPSKCSTLVFAKGRKFL